MTEEQQRAPGAFDLLREDHRQVLDCLDAARRAVPEAERTRCREALHALIAHHLEVEERILYPQIRALPGMVPVVRRLLAQHQEIRDAAAVLTDGAAETAVHERALTRLAACLERHFTLEEGELFPRFDDATGNDGDTLALEIEAERSRARGAYGVG